MPKVRVGNITLNYDQQGSGEPLVLIPYLAADCACYAFQVADYSKQFTCISIDLRGTGLSDKPAGVYSTEMFADDVAALMQVIGVPKAHISGFHWGRQLAFGWRRNTPSASSRFPCTAGGQRVTHISRLS